MNTWRPLQSAVELAAAAKRMLRDGYTHVEVEPGKAVSITEALGNRMLELLDCDPA